MNLPKDLNSASDLLLKLKKEPESVWQKRGEKRVLSLFNLMSERVPAYKDFLKKNKVNPDKIKKFSDFNLLPITNKENYLKQYPLEKLCWGGALDKGKLTIASTSGSTGEPFYFPRTKLQDEQFALTAEILFRDCFEIEKKSTLFVNCFAMGIWIGGMYMYQALKYLIDTGKYNLSVINPGAYKEEAIKAIATLGGKFDQVIVGGYAPLVKDLIDEGEDCGVQWKKFDIKFFFAAEGFSENFRDYIADKCGIKNRYLSSFNHYGTADMGTMAHETPLSIWLRRLMVNNKKLYKKILSDDTKLPTVAQYIPELFFFEEKDQSLLCSSWSGLPLLRYDLKDRGGIFTLRSVQELCAGQNISLSKELKKAGINDKIWNLPFVYVYERKDLTVSIYSVNIYPESIRRALEAKNLESSLTTKFSMSIKYDDKQNQFLEINIELKNGVKDDIMIQEKALAAIISRLLDENSEWKDFYADESIRAKVIPKLVFWPYQHPVYFKPGGKQKWVRTS